MLGCYRVEMMFIDDGVKGVWHMENGGWLLHESKVRGGEQLCWREEEEVVDRRWDAETDVSFVLEKGWLVKKERKLLELLYDGVVVLEEDDELHHPFFFFFSILLRERGYYDDKK